MGRLIVVTGGSRGIGRAIVLRAAERGYAVCFSYAANAQAADKVLAEIRSRGGEAEAVQADVAIAGDVARLFQIADQLAERHGPLHGLVNNAGMANNAHRVDELDEERLTRIFAVNVLGSFLCAREAVRRMSTRHGGRGGAIVNVSSVASRLGGAGQYVDYAATKGAIDAFTVGLAREVANEGIRVNAVSPGVTDTDMPVTIGIAQRLDILRPTIPMQRTASVDEIAAPVLWLLSDEASYTTGANLTVSGGR
jgi:NAD(P)-dependent dehydrogenase (short-subunit alcohol dehydrogenase family)